MTRSPDPIDAGQVPGGAADDEPVRARGSSLRQPSPPDAAAARVPRPDEPTTEADPAPPHRTGTARRLPAGGRDATGSDAAATEHPAPPDPTRTGFGELGVDPRLERTLVALGYEEPTPIQRLAIPPLLEGRDVLAEAPTGTGKTAAFALPLLQQLAARPRDPGRRPDLPGALVLTPTRELAMQVAEAIHRYGRELGIRVVPVYGGQPIGAQLRLLRRGAEVVVATPGRAVDHLDRGSLQFHAVRDVVLDEADEMLDMGFAEDLDRILAAVPPDHRTALFSATISRPIRRLAEQHLRDPVQLSVPVERAPAGEGPRVRQVAYVVRRADKLAALSRLLDLEDPEAALVFGRTRGEVDDLAEALSGRGHDAGALHGGMTQEQRDRVMGRFREGALEVLVATDVAARGLDIGHVTHVVNYDVPASPEDYIHRTGRTGRAGREGAAITLVEPREHRLLREIERALGASLEIGQLPTVADVRERRLDMMRAALREALLADEFDRYRGVVEPLADEFDVVDIALAAVSLVDAGTGRTEPLEELAPAALPADRRRSRGAPTHAPGIPGGRRFPTPRPRVPGAGASRPGIWTGPAAEARPGPPSRVRPPGARRPPAIGRRPVGPPRSDATRLFIGAGRSAGVGPGDLVGAIVNEAGLRPADIGAIQVADGFSLVEVPSRDVDRVIEALRAGSIRGRKAMVRRERY